MKKIVFVFIFAFAVMHSSFAQDYIYKTDGQKLTVRVVNKNSSFVFYRLLGNRDNKTLQIPLNQVYMIDFEKSGIEYVGQSQNSKSYNNSVNYNNNRNSNNNNRNNGNYNNNQSNNSNNSNYNNTNNRNNQYNQQQNSPYDPFYNNQNNNYNTNAKYRSPGVAFLWSFLLSGGGQFYNGENKKGGIMLGGAVAGWVLYFVSFSNYSSDLYSGSYSSSVPTLAYIGLAGIFAIKVWSMVDAPVSAGRINMGNGFALNFKINNNTNLALTPSVNQFSPMNNKLFYGATLSLNIH